ncbi:YbaB/EbfC family nucleoid-associated protein [Corynebacterium caspium]|uniref:YbaB/EbfC family nucleoid-associated protein n=1 Tax=Corynebacterium caspium TaxID=234828 RepID=UPI00035DB7B2|nr:YbaB/EbfC family nucleoid-associated protein [Corynebacterium caspium]WKD58538.1 Nucleoid-associated protein YbaB [Corynebacterium caspium DSM 44850]
MSNSLPDMQQILAQAQDMQNQMEAAQQEILATEIVGQAGNGLVKITMTGGGQVKEVAIDPSVVDPEDIETLQDLIAGAFTDGHVRIGTLVEEKMGPLSQGLGGDIGSLFG